MNLSEINKEGFKAMVVGLGQNIRIERIRLEYSQEEFSEVTSEGPRKKGV
jgi:hypothetical protein